MHSTYFSFPRKYIKISMVLYILFRLFCCRYCLFYFFYQLRFHNNIECNERCNGFNLFLHYWVSELDVTSIVTSVYPCNFLIRLIIRLEYIYSYMWLCSARDIVILFISILDHCHKYMNEEIKIIRN